MSDLKIDSWYTEHNIRFWLRAAAQLYVRGHDRVLKHYNTEV